MKENNIQYRMDEDDVLDRKGFIEVFITEQYNEVKQGITDRAKKAHGRYVRLREEPKPKGAVSTENDETLEVSEKTPVVAQRKKVGTIFNEAFVRIIPKMASSDVSLLETLEVQQGVTVISAQEMEELMSIHLKNKEFEAKLSVYKKEEQVQMLLEENHRYKMMVADLRARLHVLGEASDEDDGLSYLDENEFDSNQGEMVDDLSSYRTCASSGYEDNLKGGEGNTSQVNRRLRENDPRFLDDAAIGVGSPKTIEQIWDSIIPPH